VNLHYGKHHAGYVTILNTLAKDDKSLHKSLDELVKTLDAGKPFNMAAQIWNHTFYWNSMAPSKSGGGGKASGDLLKAIESAFGDYDKFATAFSAEAAGHFGSGWAWLVYCPKDKKVKVQGSHDAGNPLSKNGTGAIPLLVCDVWEHAYYVDYKNVRADYIKKWWDVINWKFAEDNYAAAVKQ